MGKIIAVTNQKGGVGKTTTAVNLSACVADQGKKVLLVDIDPQGNASGSLGHTPGKGHSVYEVLIGECEIRDAILPTCVEGLSLLPAGIDLAGAEIELVDMEDREKLLCDSLRSVAEEYDFVFIDCPPSLSLLTVNALTAADTVLIPIQCEYFALEGVGQLVRTIQLIRRRINPKLEIEGIVLTMYNVSTNLNAQVEQEVRSHFKAETYHTVIPRNVRLSEAPSYGLPINRYDSRCIGAQAYDKLAKELLRRNGG